MLSIDYSLRPATDDDFGFIHVLRVSGLREYVAQIWGWDDADQLARFRTSYYPARYQIIVLGGRDIGAIAVDWRDDEAFLSDLEILPDWQGRGLGTAVLGDLIAVAHERGLPVALQVLKGNPVRRLYERLGFVIVGETPTHYRMRTVPIDANSPRGDGS